MRAHEFRSGLRLLNTHYPEVIEALEISAGRPRKADRRVLLDLYLRMRDFRMVAERCGISVSATRSIVERAFRAARELEGLSGPGVTKKYRRAKQAIARRPQHSPEMEQYEHAVPEMLTAIARAGVILTAAVKHHPRESIVSELDIQRVRRLIRHPYTLAVASAMSSLAPEMDDALALLMNDVATRLLRLAHEHTKDKLKAAVQGTE